jgi:hypothetical protein
MIEQSIDLGTVLHFMRAALRERSAALQSGSGTVDVQYGWIVESALRQMGQAQIITLPSDLQYGSLDAKISNRNPELSRLVVEAFHHLLHNGMITRAPDPPNFPGHLNTSSFVITKRGREWAAGEEPIPEDARRYMEVLQSLVPNLDSIIRQYVEESLIAYQRQAYFAAAVMIGAACEKSVYLLADSFLRSVQDPGEKKKLDEAMQGRSISRLFGAIQELLSLKMKSKKIHYNVTEGAEQHLLSFLDSVRVQRNEAVHPNAALVTPGKVQLSLTAFPHACQKIHQLIGWLDANPI